MYVSKFLCKVFNPGFTHSLGVFPSLEFLLKFLVCFCLFIMGVIKVFALFVFYPDVGLNSDTAVCVQFVMFG